MTPASIRHAKRLERLEALQRVNTTLQLSVADKFPLLTKGKNLVPGRGSMFPEFVLVGEAPGRNENTLRQPFIGASGKLLGELLESVELTRDDVYITNAVKWWPTTPGKKPATRPPSEAEKTACRVALFAELRVLGYPPVICLGRHATGVLAAYHKGLRRAVWQRYTIKPENSYEVRSSPFYVTSLYHPAAALYQSSLKPQLFEEFKKAVETPRAAK